MERVNKDIVSNNDMNIFKKIFLAVVKNMHKGHLNLTMPNGDIHLVGNEPGLKANIKITNDSFFKKFVLYGDVGFGESYCDGDWNSDDLTQLMKWAIQNIENTGVMSGSKVKRFGLNILGGLNRLRHNFNRNSFSGSRKNISYHYDLGNDFYRLVLDKTMSYSCGIFERESNDLQNAQLNKLARICEDLNLKEGDHILEIGCGWGGFAAYAVTHFNCRVTGVTISQEQYQFAVDKIKHLGLEDKVTFILTDYRNLTGQFDKVVSVEMIEAVGHEYLPKYFQKIDQLLTPQGVAVIQAITSPDSRYDSFRSGVDFIQKHIFPGSLLPSLRSISNACEKTTFHMVNLRDIGLHYATTLRLWRNRMNENKSKILALGMDEKFLRMWNYYFSYCEAAFSERNISDVQLTFIKPNNTTYKYHNH